MKILASILLGITLFTLLACHRTESRQQPLLQAKNLMKEHPDSAQILLETIPSPEKLPIEEYATWCLLVTQAQNKNYVKCMSDSVINIAVEYFGKIKNPLHYAKALYYIGRAYGMQKDWQRAIEFYKKGEDIALLINDKSALSLSLSECENIYKQ